MSHRFVETITVSFGAAVVQAVALVPTGLFLVWTATGVLWNNEARTGFDEVAEQAAVAPVDRAGGFDGELVTVTGSLQGSAPVGDPVFFERGEYASVVRAVEMYAWQENVRTETRRNWGGSYDQDTITEYRLGWTAEPYPPGWMRYPDGHENPPMPHQSSRFGPERLSIGAWTLDPMFSLVFDGAPVAPGDVTWTEAGRRLRHADDGWYYLDGADADAPQLGDVRVRFVVARTGGRYTAVGVGSSGTLTPHSWLEGVAVVPVFPGDRANAIASLGALHGLLVWVIRIGGALAILLGLALINAPVFAILDVVPPLGIAARFLSTILLVPIALGWTVLVVCASQLLHSTGLLIIAGVLLFGVVMAWLDGRRSRARSTG